MKSRPLGIDRIQVWILSPLAPQCGKYGSLFSAKQHQNIWTDSNEYVVYCTFSLYIKIKSHTHSEAQLKSSLKIFNFILLLIKKKNTARTTVLIDLIVSDTKYWPIYQKQYQLLRQPSCSQQDHQDWASTNLTNAHSAATTLCCLFIDALPRPCVNADVTRAQQPCCPLCPPFTPCRWVNPHPPPPSPHPRSPTLPPGGDGACVPISPKRTSSRGKREQWAGEKMLSTAKLMGTQFI